MKLISVGILVPISDVPPDDLHTTTEQQHLIVALQGYLPRMIEENLEQLPYLSEFDISRDDIEVEWEGRAEQREGFRLDFYIDLPVPHESMSGVLTAALRQMVRDWLERNGYRAQSIPIEIEWRS